VSASNSGIYKLKCLPSGAFYIGSAFNFRTRWREHTRLLNQKRHVNKKLQAAWNKYGADSFTFTVLIRCDKSEVLRYEQIWMDKLQPTLNISKNASRPSPVAWTPERRIAAKERGKVLFLGKSHTAETRLLLSALAKQRLRYRGHPMQGVVWTGDRAKQAETMRRLHREGVLVSHAKLHGVSEAQREKMRVTIARNGGREGRRNGHYKPGLDAVFLATLAEVAKGASVDAARAVTGIAKSTYYKRLRGWEQADE
jgi:group I intron endonuclease